MQCKQPDLEETLFLSVDIHTSSKPEVNVIILKLEVMPVK